MDYRPTGDWNSNQCVVNLSVCVSVCVTGQQCELCGWTTDLQVTGTVISVLLICLCVCQCVLQDNSVSCVGGLQTYR